MRIKVGDKLFSPQHGFVTIDDIRGRGIDKEFAITELGQKLWRPVAWLKG